MPTSPPSLCTAPGCGTLVYGGGKCPDCLSRTRRDSDRRRPNGTQRGWTTQWATFSRRYLRDHPLCECDECKRKQEWQRPEATDVDHLDGHSRTCPHAYDKAHLQALSHACHARKTATQDGGFVGKQIGCMG